jgi:hypothetical protein
MIKKLGAIVFSLMLLSAQAFALVGGPWDSETNVYGTYATVLVPVGTADVAELPIDDPSRNSIGLFYIAVSPTEFAQGYSVMFQDGFAFVGEAVGIGDPDTGRIAGVIEGRFAQSASSGGEGGSAVEIGSIASGFFQLNQAENPYADKSLSRFSVQRVDGRATVQVRVWVATSPDTGEYVLSSTVDYLADGYKTSLNTDASTLDRPEIGIAALVGAGG